MKPAFSTVACPEWTLERVAEAAGTAGFLGVELRTFGHGSTTIACDPCLTSGTKLRDLFGAAGAEPMCLASSVRYDEPVFPPVLGRVIGDFEKSVRATKSLIEVAARMECPFVRVFAFELPAGERRGPGLRRILERLDLALRCARNTGVRLLIENGGSFPRAADLREIIDRAANPLLGAAYAPAVAAVAGEDPLEGARLLGTDLQTVKLVDQRDGQPAPLGQGDLPCEALVTQLARDGFGGWLVYEWPRLWFPQLAPAQEVLAGAAEQIYRWAATPQRPREAGRLARTT